MEIWTVFHRKIIPNFVSNQLRWNWTIVHENRSNDTKYMIRDFVWWKKHLERERRRISGAARDGSKSKCELAGKMRGEKERERGGGEKGGAETREICAGFVDPAVGPQKDEICFHFHLWQPAKISSGPISSLQTVIRLRQYFFPPSFPLLPIFLSFLPLSLYRPPIWIFRIQAKVRLPLYLYLY